MKNLPIKFKKLTKSNVSDYIDYAKRAIAAEQFLDGVECTDENAVLSRINDKFFKSTNTILAYRGGKVVGRISYHFYGCTVDGTKMAYVDWICTQKDERHQGVAQELFKKFEKECQKHGIEQYFLIAAENDEAKSFYGAFKNCETKLQPILRKDVINIDSTAKNV